MPVIIILLLIPYLLIPAALFFQERCMLCGKIYELKYALCFLVTRSTAGFDR